MPLYLKALEQAKEKRFVDSKETLFDCMKEVEQQIGKNTNYHLFLYQKIASLQMLQNDLEAVEDSFQKCV